MSKYPIIIKPYRKPKHDRRGGKREGAGRKSQREEKSLRTMLDAIWTDSKREDVIKGLVEMAEHGTLNEKKFAIKMLFEYRFGKPKETLEVQTDKPLLIMDM